MCRSNANEYKVDPYNSTIYRFTSSAKTPSIFLQQYKIPELPCYNIYATSNDEDDTEDVDDPPISTSDDDVEQKDSNPHIDMVESIKLQFPPPTMHLVKPIEITSPDNADDKYIGGVSGVEISHDYLHTLLEDITAVSGNEFEFTCKNSTKVWCYFMDFSGYILASNQNNRVDEHDGVKVGDFLGSVDPSLMRHLIEKDTFDEKPEYNYAALCEKPVECNKDISAAPSSHMANLIKFPIRFISSLLQSSVTFLYQLNIAVLR